METLLLPLTIILFLVVVIGILNEKTLKLPHDISLVLFALIIGAVIKILMHFGFVSAEDGIIGAVSRVRFDELMLEGIHCFIVFAFASSIRFEKLVKNIGAISCLAILTTVLSSLVFGTLFWLIGLSAGFGIDFATCVLIGCIVTPTEPIAVLKPLIKAGLSKNVAAVIEGEALFNAGISVALFLFVKNIISNKSGHSFPVQMARELLLAVAIGFVISFVCMRVLFMTKNPHMHLFISLFAVTACYVVCESIHCSGTIASVVCGMYFSNCMNKHERWRTVVDPYNIYEIFWETADVIINSILFILIGISVIGMPYDKFAILYIAVAIAANFAARCSGVAVSSFIARGSIPGHYSVGEFTVLMTWSAMRGGLSLALALTTAEFLPESICNAVMIVTLTVVCSTTVLQGLSSEKIFRRVEAHKERRLAQAATERKSKNK